MKVAAAAQDNEAAADASLANQQELERSARMADANAVDSLRKASLLTGRARSAGTVLQRRQEMAFAANGIDSSSGSAARLVSETGRISELEAQTLRNNGFREAFGHKETARGYRRQRDELIRGDRARASALGLRLFGDVMGLGGDVAYAGTKGKGGGNGGGE